MSEFVDKVTELLKEQKITKNQMLKDLNLSRNSFVDWNKRGTIPSANVVSAIADYLGTTISTLMGYPEEEERIDSFSAKLSFQIAVNCTSIFEVAKYLKISDETVMDWIKGSDMSYIDYLDQLSNFFEVMPRYWTSPGMISPGIEPNTNEYLLILLYRTYRETGKYNENDYGSLEYYFPGINIISDDEEMDILSLFRKLNEDSKDIIKGELKKVLRSQRYDESVAADKSLGKTGTTNSAK